MADDEEAKELKIILLGESGVGKTCIINRYVNNEFVSESSSSLGCYSNKKEITKNKDKYIIDIWDTTGQEKYHSVTNLFIKGSDAIILVYSIDSRNSFDGLDYWYNSVQEKLEERNYILAVVGSKSDLTDNEEVSEEEGMKYAEGKNAIFKLVSAKEDAKGIESLFDEILNNYIASYRRNQAPSFSISSTQRVKKKKCC